MRVGGVKNRSRPMPPLLGNGDAVDLLKLFINVKKRGGHDAITRDGLWEEVGEDQGLRCLGIGSAIKLIYYKYFLMTEKEPNYVDLCLDESDLVRCGSEILKERTNNGGSEEGSRDGSKLFGGKNYVNADEVEVIEIDSDSSDNEMDWINQDVSKLDKANDNVKGAEIFSNVEMLSKEKSGEKELSATKRKRECASSKMMAWLDSVAKDPANPVIGTLPESSRWKSYGAEHCWKQVLLTRDVLFHRKQHDSSPELFPSQKKQKMHPSMFDDETVCREDAEKMIRSSPRLHLLGSLGTSNHISSLSSFNFRKHIPVGPCFQVEVPEWTGAQAETESKWLGTRIWPPEDKSLVYALEDNLVQNSTRNHFTREFLGSVECVRTHVSRRRMKLKAELGSAFKEHKFDSMGEEVAASWTKKEEMKFIDVVRENPWSQGKRFWNEMSKKFPTKSREELVSYYFNVFVLRRRAQQNRYSPSNIDSDDDETEFVSKSPGLFRSPENKKSL